MTKKSDNEPKILILDIETSPNVVYCWKTGFKLNISPDSIIEERQIICIAYKWSGGKKAKVLTWDPKKKHDKDKQLLKDFTKVYAEADMVVAHNGDSFDMKWIRGRILFHKLKPLPMVKQCDTLKDFRRMFGLNSNKLDYIAKFLGYEGKKTMKFQDWKDTMAGSAKALKKMADYCKQDVEEVDSIFLESRPYIDNGNIYQAIKHDRSGCPSCGNEKTQKYGAYRTKAGS
ncbi:ribonuclease H-like domain-containing protein, partial [Candidatus Babeliales bacterium]|nr:ribonuclease H-like domain-containing protein [Candidatus Babeliales bacterium]